MAKRSETLIVREGWTKTPSQQRAFSLSFNTLMSANVTSLCLQVPRLPRRCRRLCKGVFTAAWILLEDEALFSRWYLRLPIPRDPPNFYIVFGKSFDAVASVHLPFLSFFIDSSFGPRFLYRRHAAWRFESRVTGTAWK